MNNIFKHKDTQEEVNLIHLGKMKKSKETVAVYELEEDKTILVMPLNEFNHSYQQNDYAAHDHFTNK